MIKTLTILIILTAACFAADEKVALPSSTSTAIKVYDAEMAKAKAEYDRKEAAANKVLAVALKKAQDIETKAGNLEGALAIKKRIEELTPDLLGEKLDIAKTIIGKWDVINPENVNIGYFEVLPGGKGNSTWGALTWKNNGNNVTLTQNSSIHNVTIIDINNLEAIRNDSRKYKLTRINLP